MAEMFKPGWLETDCIVSIIVDSHDHLHGSGALISMAIFASPPINVLDSDSSSQSDV